MAKKKKKQDRALILLLLALLIGAFLYNQGYLGGGTPGGTPNTTPDGSTCCCDDLYAYIYKLPNGTCQCLTCTDTFPNILIKEEGVCCTANTCDGGLE